MRNRNPLEPLKKKVQFAEAVGNELIQRTVVPKNRKPKFELLFKLIYLNNVPLVTGQCYAKWQLPSSTAAEHRGKTARAPIKDHLVTWDYEKRIELRLVVDKSGGLQPSELAIEVVQEWAAVGAGRHEQHALLGRVTLDLAEYVAACEETEEPVARRYLMKDSKINSTVKISLFIRQIEGEKNYIAPPLKTAPIFGNISGVINFEQGERDESGHLTSVSNKVNRDIHEMRNAYRQTLTAAWSSRPHELPADECIEDIFAGGDGYGHTFNGHGHRRKKSRRRQQESDEDDDDDEDDGDERTPTPPPASRQTNGEHTPRASLAGRHHHHGKVSHHHQTSKSSERTIRNGAPQQTSSSSDDRHEDGDGRPRLTEADLREDMRSWHIGPQPP